MSGTYRYDPLQEDHIRVLSITREDGKYYFTLSPVNLRNSPQYTAISYTWLSGERTQRLYLKGNDIVLPITQTAYDVIRNVSDNHSTLWIDMICINQDDNAEKSVQVAMMGTVYQKSTHTVAYLSKPPQEHGNDPAAVTDEDENTAILYERYKWRRSKIPLARTSMAFYDLQDVDVEQSVKWLFREAVAQITKPAVSVIPPPWTVRWRESSQELQRTRPYFFRKWIIQEIIRSPCITFQAGSHKMDLVDVGSMGWGEGGSVFDLKAAYPQSGTIANTLKIQDGYLSSLRGKNRELYDEIKDAQSDDYSQERYSSSLAFRLLALLVDTHTFNVTNVRDALFAILPLLDDTIPAEFCPDYDATPETIFKRFSRYMLCNNAAEAIGVVRFGHNSSLPSWCADWSKPLGSQSVEFAGTFPGNLRAGYMKGSRRQMIRADGDDAMLMRGKLVHIVDKVERWSSREWDDFMQDEAKLVATQGADAAVGFYFWRERVVQHDRPFGGYPFASVVDMKGSIGLVPKESMPGDAVVVILGLQPLYLLRKAGSDWEIIGECFIPTYMRGEQLDGLERAYDEQAEAPWQDFRVI